MSDDPKSRQPTVFGYVDQQEVIARIDNVTDDDLSSCFFGDSIQEVENAATSMFHIGMRGETEPNSGPAQPSAFEVPTHSDQPREVVEAALTQPVAVTRPAGPMADAEARAAFILHGPGSSTG